MGKDKQNKQLTVDLTTKGVKEFIDFVKGTKVATLSLQKGGQKITVTQNLQAAAAQPATAIERPSAASLDRVKSDAVGTLKFAKGVTAGHTCQEGDLLAVIAAVGIEHKIAAPKSGLVKELLEEDGAAVDYGRPLLLLE